VTDAHPLDLLRRRDVHIAEVLHNNESSVSLIEPWMDAVTNSDVVFGVISASRHDISSWNRTFIVQLNCRPRRAAGFG